MKIGVIDVGGGMRGIYAAGIFDTCLKQDIVFDYCIGISAGSANIASYLAGQPGRNYRFYHDYSFRSQYMGLQNWLRTGSFINLEYIYGTLSNGDGEDPLDYRHFAGTKAELIYIASDAETGAVKLFHRGDIAENDYRVLMASSCVPGVNKPIRIGNSLYYDGALADPVPVDRAFDDGCDLVVLILTKPVGMLRTQGKDKYLAKMIRRKYPLAAKNMLQRAERYNSAVRRALEYEKQGKVLILSPDDITGVDTLRKNKNALHRLYEKGVRDGERIPEWLSERCGSTC